MSSHQEPAEPAVDPAAGAEPADDPAGESSVRAAGPAPHRHLLGVTLGVATVVVLIDQVTKWLVVTHLTPGEPVQVLGDLLRLTFVENSGAAFSLGAGFTVIFTAIAITVVVVVIRTASRLGSVAWAVALGGLLGGALGNLVDRLTRAPGIGRGYVVDFLQLPHWAVFNCADMAIVGSAILMVVLAVRGVDLDGSRAARGSAGA